MPSKLPTINAVTGEETAPEERIYPLSAHALACLRSIAVKPAPRQFINSGVVGRLLRGGLVEVVDLPSPFKTHKGQMIQHLSVTEAGRRMLASTGKP